MMQILTNANLLRDSDFLFCFIRHKNSAIQEKKYGNMALRRWFWISTFYE
jgi:hypothetical protein